MSIHAQDKIEEFTNMYSDTSIVRSMSNGNFLFYNRIGFKSSFIMVSGASSSSDQLQLEDYIYIKDFDIYGNMVYFCGYMPSGQGSEAIVGYFSLLSFPTTQVFYYHYTDAISFNKIDTYEILSPTFERHAVMTGSISATQGCVVDAYPISSTQWMIECCALPVNEQYDDVATRNSRIVISSRGYSNSGSFVGKLWCYSKPTVSGTTIFSTSLYRKIISYPVPSSPIWMEKCSNDNLAITFGANNNKDMIVTSMDLFANGPVYLQFPKQIFPREIRYNPTDHELEVIIADKKNENRIIQFSQQVFSGSFLGGFTPERSFRPSLDMLCSFDYNPLNRCFDVTGYRNDDHRLCFYKYLYSKWGNCSPKYSHFVAPIAFSGWTEDDYIPLTFPTQHLKIEMNVEKYTVNHESVCQ